MRQSFFRILKNMGSKVIIASLILASVPGPAYAGKIKKSAIGTGVAGGIAMGALNASKAASTGTFWALSGGGNTAAVIGAGFGSFIVPALIPMAAAGVVYGLYKFGKWLKRKYWDDPIYEGKYFPAGTDSAEVKEVLRQRADQFCSLRTLGRVKHASDFDVVGYNGDSSLRVIPMDGKSVRKKNYVKKLPRTGADIWAITDLNCDPSEPQNDFAGIDPYASDLRQANQYRPLIQPQYDNRVYSGNGQKSYRYDYYENNYDDGSYPSGRSRSAAGAR